LTKNKELPIGAQGHINLSDGVSSFHLCSLWLCAVGFHILSQQ